MKSRFRYVSFAFVLFALLASLLGSGVDIKPASAAPAVGDAIAYLCPNGMIVFGSTTCPWTTTYIFVKTDGSSSGDCNTWGNACTLQYAISRAQSVVSFGLLSKAEIWVKAGTYKPHASDRSISFSPGNLIKIYGGFAGTEISLSERNPALNVTILSGDLSGNDLPGFVNNGENSYHVVNLSATGDSAALDGFTITGGNADGTGDANSSIGGGFFIDAGSPQLYNLNIQGNSASAAGGGIYDANSNITLSSVTFSGNTATGDGGGGMYNHTSSLDISNATFSGNTGGGYGGGGMLNYASSPMLRNVTFSENIAGGLANYASSSPTLTNTIIANSVSGGDCAQADGALNVNSSHNLIEDASNACGLINGTNNDIVGQDPMLGALGNYGGFTQTLPLLLGSPAIDTGRNPVTVTAGTPPNTYPLTTWHCLPTDQRGVTRPKNVTCDMGAYEYDPIVNATRYVVPSGGLSAGLCNSWANACTLQYALFLAIPNDQIWIKEGIYTPHASDRAVSFQLKNNVQIYGGFAGNETMLVQRDPRTHPTILSGDLSGNDLPGFVNNGENSYHVVNLSATNNTAVLDGFTIAGGNANSVDWPDYNGGGIYNYGGLANLTNLTIRDNYASNGGAGVLTEAFGNITLTHSTITANTAGAGGGVYNYYSSPAMTNVTIAHNSAGAWGGGYVNYASSPVLKNVTISNNSGLAGSGGGMFNAANSAPVLYNTIIANSASGGDCVNEDSAIAPSSAGNLIEDLFNSCGLTNGVSSNIVGQDPMLGALTYHSGYTQTMQLPPDSPATNTGANGTCAATDQRGMSRPQAGICDMGAFETIYPDILRADANPTSANLIHFSVMFPSGVTGVDINDFKLTNTLITDAYITGVSNFVSDFYTVTVNTGSGDGTIRLDIPATATIQDIAFGDPIGRYSKGQAYTIQKGAALTVPILTTPLTGALVTSAPTLNWNESSEVVALANPWSYEVQITSLNGYDHIFNTISGLENSTLSDFSAAPLSSNTTYSWKVRAYNGTNQYSAWSLTRTFRTKLATPVLASPADAAAPALLNKRPTFQWSGVSGATGYTIQISKLSLPVSTITLTGTTYAPTADLLPNTTYTWKVKANGLNAGDYSSPFTFTTSLNAPTVPVLLAPVANALVDSSAPVTLDWKPVLAVNTTSPATTYPAAASYDVEYATNIGFIGSTLVNTVTDQYPFPGLLPAHTTYYWRVRSINATGQISVWSATWIFKTRVATTVLNAPVSGSLLNNKRPVFEWDAVDGAISYTLQIFKKNTTTNLFTVLVHTGTILAPKYVYTPTVDLLPSTEYAWQVKANNMVYLGLYSAQSTFTTSVNPPKPPMQTAPLTGASILSSANPNLVWTAPLSSGLITSPATYFPLATGYDVQVSTNPAFENISPSNNVKTLNVATTNATLLDVLTTGTAPDNVIRPGRMYYWRVRSISAAGNYSSWTTPARTILVKFVAPTLVAPANLATGVSRTAPTFTWNSGDNGLWTNYTIQLATTPPTATTFTVVKSFTLILAPKQTYTANLTAATQLLSNKTYYWRVQINGLYTPIFSLQNFLTSYSFTTAP